MAQNAAPASNAAFHIEVMGFPPSFPPVPIGPSSRTRAREFRQFIEQRIADTITRTGEARQPIFHQVMKMMLPRDAGGLSRND
jgi:hypothetical protein